MMSTQIIEGRVAWRQRLLWGLLALALTVPLGVATGYQWLPVLRAQVAGSRAAGPLPTSTVALPGTEVPTLPSPHIARLGAPHAGYNSVPPTSGPHLAWTIAPGVYQESVPDELAVHALEHGHIVVRYAPSTAPDQVGLLARVARRYPRDVVLAPYPQLDSGVALTAWGRLDRLSTVDEARVDAFVNLLRGRYNHGWVRDWHPGVATVSASGDGCGSCCGC
jgi:hypothetical protein